MTASSPKKSSTSKPKSQPKAGSTSNPDTKQNEMKDEPEIIAPKPSDAKAEIEYCPYCMRLGSETGNCARKVVPCPPTKTVPTDQASVYEVAAADGSVEHFAVPVKAVCKRLTLGKGARHDSIVTIIDNKTR